VIISVGKGVEIDSLGPVPAHVHLRAQVDQIAVLERATLFVSHGGMNSLCEAVSAGTPLLLFPQINDQIPLAQLMEREGLGYVLDTAALSARSLRAVTKRVLNDPGMRARTRAFGERIQASGSAARAADVIFAELGKRPPVQHLSTTHEAPLNGTVTHSEV